MINESQKSDYMVKAYGKHYLPILHQELQHLANRENQVTTEDLIEAMGDAWHMTGGVAVNDDDDDEAVNSFQCIRSF